MENGKSVKCCHGMKRARNSIKGNLDLLLPSQSSDVGYMNDVIEKS